MFQLDVTAMTTRAAVLFLVPLLASFARAQGTVLSFCDPLCTSLVSPCQSNSRCAGHVWELRDLCMECCTGRRGPDTCGYILNQPCDCFWRKDVLDWYDDEDEEEEEEEEEERAAWWYGNDLGWEYEVEDSNEQEDWQYPFEEGFDEERVEDHGPWDSEEYTTDDEEDNHDASGSLWGPKYAALGDQPNWPSFLSWGADAKGRDDERIDRFSPNDEGTEDGEDDEEISWSPGEEREESDRLDTNILHVSVDPPKPSNATKPLRKPTALGILPCPSKYSFPPLNDTWVYNC